MHSAPVNQCFGCGPDNPVGLHLQFTLGRSTQGMPTARAIVLLSSLYQGGSGKAHGGILATLMDEAMSKLNKPLGVHAVTRRLEVDYLRPVPTGRNFTLTATHVRRDGRKLFHTAKVTDEEGTEYVEASALFVVIRTLPS